MRRLLMIGSSGVLLSGCEGKFIVPWMSAELLRIDMLGVTVSWPVIAVAVALLAAVWGIKAKLRRAREDK